MTALRVGRVPYLCSKLMSDTQTLNRSCSSRNETAFSPRSATDRAPCRVYSIFEYGTMLEGKRMAVVGKKERIRHKNSVARSFYIYPREHRCVLCSNRIPTHRQKRVCAVCP